MDRRLALAALLAIPCLTLLFRTLPSLGLRPLEAYLLALALYWLLLLVALTRGGWSLALHWPGWPLGVTLALVVLAFAQPGLPALAGLSPHVLAVVVLASAINGPLEEAFWRGALVPRLGRGDWLAAMPAVALFGLWHIAPALAGGITMPGGAMATVLGATVLGALLMAARLRSGTAGIGALTHALINLSAFAALAAANATPA